MYTDLNIIFLKLDVFFHDVKFSYKLARFGLCCTNGFISMPFPSFLFGSTILTTFFFRIHFVTATYREATINWNQISPIFL